ncbi:MAG: hypothetical protein E2O68_01130 [Deltaproteobacteria bacterium]|nr:MAG: hypothetical protein E2O68_01130 [Deltaproteobacteria bacterium]
MANEVIENEAKCFSCHKPTELEFGRKILRHEECPTCGASMHCCKMCKYYDPTAYNECKETIAERIVDKEKANFCEFFFLVGDTGEYEKKADSMDLANSLFKK